MQAQLDIVKVPQSFESRYPPLKNPGGNMQQSIRRDENEEIYERDSGRVVVSGQMPMHFGVGIYLLGLPIFPRCQPAGTRISFRRFLYIELPTYFVRSGRPAVTLRPP